MGISQILFDAIQSIERELNTSGEFGEDLRRDIAVLVGRMKEVQRSLDSEATEMDGREEE
jgi:hypothetical protein